MGGGVIPERLLAWIAIGVVFVLVAMLEERKTNA